MAGRGRPSGSTNVPTEDEKAEAAAVVAECLDDLRSAANSAVMRLGRISNPVERAKAAAEVRRYTSKELPPVTDTLFRSAVLEAYTRGRSEHGWYGYGALAEELGLSRARVQQVVTGSWKDSKDRDPDLLKTLRDEADQTRLVRRLGAAGRTVEEIGAETGLSEAAVSDLLH